MENPIKPILVRYGGADKPLNEMSKAELETAAKSIVRRAKEKAFSKGLPIYYATDGNLVAEYADGRKVIVKKLTNVSKNLRGRRAQWHR